VLITRRSRSRGHDLGARQLDHILIANGQVLGTIAAYRPALLLFD
jgi:hypothetical protein